MIRETVIRDYCLCGLLSLESATPAALCGAASHPEHYRCLDSGTHDEPHDKSNSQENGRFHGRPPGQQHSRTEPYSKRLDLRIKRMAWIDEPPCA